MGQGVSGVRPPAGRGGSQRGPRLPNELQSPQQRPPALPPQHTGMHFNKFTLEVHSQGLGRMRGAFAFCQISQRAKYMSSRAVSPVLNFGPRKEAWTTLGVGRQLPEGPPELCSDATASPGPHPIAFVKSRRRSTQTYAPGKAGASGRRTLLQSRPRCGTKPAPMASPDEGGLSWSWGADWVVPQDCRPIHGPGEPHEPAAFVNPAPRLPVFSREVPR